MLHRIAETQEPLPAPVVVLIGLAVLVVGVLPEIWKLVEHLDTIAHEGAHAVVGSSLGWSVVSVELHHDTAGATWMVRRRPSTPTFVVVGIVGYVGPSGFGLAAAKLISRGHIIAVLWLGLLLLVLLLPTVRNGFGVFSVSLTGAVLFVLVRYAAVGLQTVAAYTLTWAMLVTGLRTTLSHGGQAFDARLLARITHLPRFIWAALWLACSFTGLTLGAGLLL